MKPFTAHDGDFDERDTRVLVVSLHMAVSRRVIIQVNLEPVAVFGKRSGHSRLLSGVGNEYRLPDAALQAYCRGSGAHSTTQYIPLFSSLESNFFVKKK